MQRDAVVRPERLRLDVERVAKPGRERHRPRRVHAPAERREDADAPVADLVSEALDDDRPVGRDDAGRRLLLAEEGDEVARCALVEPVVRSEPRRRVVVVARDELASRGADAFPELRRAADALSLPEGGDTRHSRSRGDEDPVARDVLDAPGGGPEQEGLTLASLVHHLLVELAHAPAAVDEVDAEEAAVGDRAGIRHRQPPGTRAAADDACRAVPDDPRSKLRELVRGVAAGEHVENVLELRPREVGERVRAADELMEVLDRDLLVGADGDHLLREDVERVARDASLLDRALPHRSRDDGRLEQVGPELREDAPFETEWRSCPARPTRCSPRATDFGLSTWITRSTAPMSIPSSRDEVATRHGMPPAFRAPRPARCSRASEPWWARASSSPASSFRRSASRSASRRLLTNTIVERCSRTSSRIAG